LKKFIFYSFTSFSLILFSLFSSAEELSLEVRDPGNSLVISTDINEGILDFGSVDALGLNKGNPALVDNMFFVNDTNELFTNRNTDNTIPSGVLYVIGGSMSLGALEINAVNTSETTSADLTISCLGSLDFYISKSDTPWAEGTLLGDSLHPKLPNNNFQVVIKGNNGILDPNPVTSSDSNILIDLAVKISLETLQGENSSEITFTLVSE
jgi:hypothetical protein